MKPISFRGNRLECLRDFPEEARHDAGYALDQVHRGKQPSDFKPMATVCVLHALHKRTRATSKPDIEMAKSRFTELMRGRR